MDEHASPGNIHEDRNHLQRVKDKLTSLVNEAPKAMGAVKEKLPLDVAERTARSIWSKIKREKKEKAVAPEDERPLSRWEQAALHLEHPPIPNLRTTEQMLRSASALVRTEHQHKMTSFGLLLHELGFARRQQKAVEQIIAGNAHALESGNVREVRNPTTEGFEAYLAGNEEPLPFSTNHSEVLKDDPAKMNDVDRTAALIYGTAVVCNDVRAESWEPEISKKKSLEMRGYKRAFGKREAGEKGDTLVSVLDSKHVTVIIDGVMFKLNVFQPDGSPVTPDEIRANIAAMKASVHEPPEVGAGVITTLNRRDVKHVRDELKKDPANVPILQDIDSSLWTFIIDTEAQPADLEQTSSLMQYGTFNTGQLEHSEEEMPPKKFGITNISGFEQYISPGGWYDGQSIRVTSNGKAGGNFEHLAIDGSEAMHMLNSIGTIAEHVTFNEAAPAVTPTFEPLPLNIPEVTLRAAQNIYIQEIEKQSLSVIDVEMKYEDIHYFDSSIQIALAAAQYEANGNKPSFAIEPMNLRHQMGGRLGYGLLNLHAMQKYVEWMAGHPNRYADVVVAAHDEEGRTLRNEAAQLNIDARNSHSGMLKEVKDGNAPLNHLTTLTGIFKDELADKGAYVRDVEAFFTALDSGLYQMARGNVMTNGGDREHIDSFATIASMSVDGIGIGYSKKKSTDSSSKNGHIVFTIRAKGASQDKVSVLKKAIPKYLDFVLRDQLKQY